MNISGYKKKIYDKWISLTIKNKISIFTKVVFLIILLSVAFDVWVVNFSLTDFRVILEDNSKSSNFMDAIEDESDCFTEYIKNSNEENYYDMKEAFLKTEKAVEVLPYDTAMSTLRYSQTWSIKNSYENYVRNRDAIINLEEESTGYITKLYQVYAMQDYLEDYARRLMRYTLEDGDQVYEEKVFSLKMVPFVVIAVGVLLFGTMVSLAKGMNKTIIFPIMNLVGAAKKIASNDFYTEDIKVENQDEIGELVKAFNKMKYATGQYIMALEESRKVLDLLHKEELEKIEAEKHLETMNLDLLKSQINPHFLFNTLNVIGGMAKLEEAETTEKMIHVLSAIFRYNLKTPENEVVLSQEIQVVNDYMYLQEMRFGSRITYSVICKVDEDIVFVPTFLLQPIVENAIIHGLSPKEEGGKIWIRIWEENNKIIISIADSGVGIEKQDLESLKKACKKGKTGKVGIGLGNVYKRVHAMYKEGDVEVFSKKDIGTIVRISIPNYEEEV